MIDKFGYVIFFLTVLKKRNFRSRLLGKIRLDTSISAKVRLLFLLLSVLLITIGYGVSFPLLAIRLEDMEVPSSLIGLNAAMPALGWLFVTPLLPKLHTIYSTKALMLGFLSISLLGLIGFALVETFSWWLVFRLAFGGGLGMFFRVVEYWLNCATHHKNRGRIIGTYAVCFLSGIAIGSLLQPSLGTTGVLVFLSVGAPILLGAALLSIISFDVTKEHGHSASFQFFKSVAITAPIAMAGVVAYGLIEDVPAYLLSVYSLKLGMGNDTAAFTLTAFVSGTLLFAIPLGALSDKVGRLSVIFSCAFFGAIGAALIPLSTQNTEIYLLLIAVWGGFVGGLYNLSLAYLGDCFDGSALISANAVFGTIYAGAAMIGPLINGSAMQLWEPHGLMVSCAGIFGVFLVFSCFVRAGVKIRKPMRNL